MNATLNKFFFWISILSLIVVELFCAKLAFETIGEVASGVYFFAVLLNIIPIALLLLRKQQAVAVSVIFFIGVIIVPYQIFLGNKLLLLKEEASNITAFIYDQKIKDGNYPQNLSDYQFLHQSIKKHFDYRIESNDKFVVSFYVGTQGTSHFYSSEIKRWEYYPD